MPGLEHLMSRVVERKGFHVQGADSEALLAKKGEDTLLAAWKLDAPLTLQDATIFLSAMEQVRAVNGILVATKGADQTAKDVLAAAKGIEVWPESRLVIEVGDAFVKDALERPSTPSLPATPAPAPAAGPAGPRKFPSLVAHAATAATSSGHGIAYFMPNKKQEQPADMRATIQQGRGGSLGYAWGGATGSSQPSHASIATVMPSKPRIKTDQWGNVVKGDPNAPSAAMAPTAMPAIRDAEEEAYEIITPKKKEKPAASVKAVVAPVCTTLKLNISGEDAVAKVGKPGMAKLALVPQVAFDYAVNMERPDMPEPVTGSGAILVNSLTGDLRPVDALAYNDVEPQAARKDAEKMTAVDVYDKVKSFLGKTFARTMNVEKDVAGNTVMSTLKLSPDPEEMGLEHRGIVYLPVWEVTTSTGVTKIDAFTGNLL